MSFLLLPLRSIRVFVCFNDFSWRLSSLYSASFPNQRCIIIVAGARVQRRSLRLGTAFTIYANSYKSLTFRSVLLLFSLVCALPFLDNKIYFPHLCGHYLSLLEKVFGISGFVDEGLTAIKAPITRFKNSWELVTFSESICSVSAGLRRVLSPISLEDLRLTFHQKKLPVSCSQIVGCDVVVIQSSGLSSSTYFGILHNKKKIVSLLHPLSWKNKSIPQHPNVMPIDLKGDPVEHFIDHLLTFSEIHFGSTVSALLLVDAFKHRTSNSFNTSISFFYHHSKGSPDMFPLLKAVNPCLDVQVISNNDGEFNPNFL